MKKMRDMRKMKNVREMRKMKNVRKMKKIENSYKDHSDSCDFPYYYVISYLKHTSI